MTSLLLVEERLLEAEHFTMLLKEHFGLEIQFNLNAFLSAARAVTFLIQKELRHVPNFDEYWASVQATLREDEAARFFLEMRNFSQKQGRIGLYGSGGTRKLRSYTFPHLLGEEPRMIYFFVNGELSVPDSIACLDIVSACAQHIGKLAELTLQTMKEFPFDCCLSAACTPEGAEYHSLELPDFLKMLGFPTDWMVGVDGMERQEAFKLVARQFDAVDVKSIGRIAQFNEILTSDA
ncbi:hypothetical protein [Roseobacter sp. S98]|uniref:hypothetical protein n=1 Tax=Roseobacter algicola (ex Choi et al. 2025) (nom. illeg.) TaxID=3092138 RepID=UPI0035C76367